MEPPYTSAPDALAIDVYKRQGQSKSQYKMLPASLLHTNIYTFSVFPPILVNNVDFISFIPVEMEEIKETFIFSLSPIF